MWRLTRSSSLQSVINRRNSSQPDLTAVICPSRSELVNFSIAAFSSVRKPNNVPAATNQHRIMNQHRITNQHRILSSQLAEANLFFTIRHQRKSKTFEHFYFILHLSTSQKNHNQIITMATTKMKITPSVLKK